MKNFKLYYNQIFHMSIIILCSAFLCNYVIYKYNNKFKVNIQDLSIIIYDKDNSQLSKELCKTLDSKINIKIVSDENQGISYISNGKSELFMVIKNNYDRSIKEANISDLIIVYPGYNPKHTNLLLEIIGKEVLKSWTNYKINNYNRKLNIELDWSQLYENKEKSITIKEITINEKKDIVNEGFNAKEYDKNNIKSIIIMANSISMFLTCTILILILGKKFLKDKLKGLIARVNIFHPKGKKVYRFKFINNVIIIFILNLIVYGIIFYINKISISSIILIFLIFLVYTLIVASLIKVIINRGTVHL